MAKILQKTDSGLVLERPQIFHDIKIGCSISVSGVCLSVTSFDETMMSFDVIPTTYSKTKLGSLKVGDSVNLERAMKADGRFEGHIVTGHVEGTGMVGANEGTLLKLHIPQSLLPYIVHHGSITLDGVALTVADLKDDEVTVALIPLTYKETTLGSLQKGDTVNLETDIVGRYILQAHGNI
jgi:riboflavin synthase